MDIFLESPPHSEHPHAGSSRTLPGFLFIVSKFWGGGLTRNQGVLRAFLTLAPDELSSLPPHLWPDLACVPSI